MQSLIGQSSVGTRADVEEQIGILACRTDKEAYDLAGRLIVIVGDVISPRAVHRLTRLKRQGGNFLPREAGLVLTRQIPLEELEILARDRCHVVIVADQASRL